VVDLAGPRTDGSFLVAAAGRLLILGRDATLRPFARGAGGYLTATGTEPYLVLTSSDPVRGSHCSFGNDTAFAIEPSSGRRLPCRPVLGAQQAPGRQCHLAAVGGGTGAGRNPVR